MSLGIPTGIPPGGNLMSDTINFDDIDEYGPETYTGTFNLDTATLDREELSGMASISIEARVEASGIEGEYLADGPRI